MIRKRSPAGVLQTTLQILVGCFVVRSRKSQTANSENSHQTAVMALSGQHSTTPIQADIAAAAIDSSPKPPLTKDELDDELRWLVLIRPVTLKLCSPQIS